MMLEKKVEQNAQMYSQLWATIDQGLRRNAV